MIKYLIIMFTTIIAFLAKDLYAYPKSELIVHIEPDKGNLYGFMRVSNLKTKPQFLYRDITIKNLIENLNDNTISIEFHKNISDNFFHFGKEQKDIYLTLFDDWFPKLSELAIYKLTVIINRDDLIPISEADFVLKKGNEYTFVFDHPRKEISLICGRFHIDSTKYKDIEISTYFLNTDQELSQLYMNKIKNFIDIYEEKLGKYPYKRFSIVENPIQTGYGFATYTLLGSQVIRLPFIPDISLRHEFVHSWFGNYIYVDYNSGNWVEGLTTYLSDHQYELERQNDTQYRKLAIQKYLAYNSKDSFPLSKFKSNLNKKWESIGYVKGMFLFHEIRNILNEDNFYKALRDFISEYKYKEASWNDLKHIFQRYTNIDLTQLFTQYLNRTDIPKIAINKVKFEPNNKGNFDLKFTITQLTSDPYILNLTFLVETIYETKKFTAKINETQSEIIVSLDALPLRLVVDPFYDTLRQLNWIEVQPLLHFPLGAHEGTILVKKEERSFYEDIISLLNQLNKNYTILEFDNKITFDPIKKQNSLIILGSIPDNLKKIIPEPQINSYDSYINVLKNIEEYTFITLIKAKDKHSLESIKNRLPHYGNYSIIVNNNRKIEKKTTDTEKGIVVNVFSESIVLSRERNYNISEFIDEVMKNKIILIGEKHNRYEHHIAQLLIIQGLHRKGAKIAVGMEMFQEPYQHVLDAFIRGELDEEEFLIRSDYFNRWGFDYRLYKPIIDFCRENKIPIIALNASTELTKLISAHGIDFLKQVDLDNMPFLDITIDEYRELLKKVHESHKGHLSREFYNFYLAQLLWDETMAKNAYHIHQKEPDRIIVILAGKGHVENNYGIPARLKRLGINEIKTILISSNGFEGINKSDYVLQIEEINLPNSIRLGVTIEEEADGLRVKELEKGGLAEKAGIKINDKIIAINEKPINDTNILRYRLSTYNPLTPLKITVQRHISGKKEDIFIKPDT